MRRDNPFKLRVFAAESAAALVALALALAWPALASAWGPLGHQAVGAVAQARLTPHALEQVQALLAADLDADGRPSGRSSLAQVSTWADEIRGGEADRPRWHFDDAPVCAALAGPGWCSGGDCASRRVEQQLAVLADERQPLRARNEALKWVVHLVGDMHQPLHAADYAHGATQVPVELAGRKDKRALTLHGAWDVRLVSSALHAGQTRGVPPEALERLLKKAGKASTAAVHAPVQAWLKESNALARSVALDYPGFACGEAPPDARQPVLLSRQYQQRAEALVVDRLALAGARLAQVLNGALDR